MAIRLIVEGGQKIAQQWEEGRKAVLRYAAALKLIKPPRVGDPWLGMGGGTPSAGGGGDDEGGTTISPARRLRAAAKVAGLRKVGGLIGAAGVLGTPATLGVAAFSLAVHKLVDSADGAADRFIEVSRKVTALREEVRAQLTQKGKEYLDEIIKEGGPRGTEGFIKQAAQVKKLIEQADPATLKAAVGVGAYRADLAAQRNPAMQKAFEAGREGLLELGDLRKGADRESPGAYTLREWGRNLTLGAYGGSYLRRFQEALDQHDKSMAALIAAALAEESERNALRSQYSSSKAGR